MATSIDVGDSTDVHPRNKKPIGIRLADLALKVSECGTKEKHLAIRDFYIRHLTSDDRVILEFDKKTKLNTLDESSVLGFEGIDSKGTSHSLKAEIKDHTIQISIPKKENNVIFLRYGWAPYSRANIIINNLHPLPSFQQKLQEKGKVRIF